MFSIDSGLGVAARPEGYFSGAPPIELQLNTRSELYTNVEFEVFVEGRVVEAIGDYGRDWRVFPLAPSDLDALRGGLLEIKLLCEVDEVCFRLKPGYMEGFEAWVHAERMRAPEAGRWRFVDQYPLE